MQRVNIPGDGSKLRRTLSRSVERRRRSGRSPSRPRSPPTAPVARSAATVRSGRFLLSRWSPRSRSGSRSRSSFLPRSHSRTGRLTGTS